MPFEKTTAARVRQALDAHATQWALARRAACGATWFERTQSERLLDLRMRCLDRAKDELGAVATFFAQADEATMTSATSVLSSLRPLEWCADARLLSSAVAPPTPAQSAAVTSVRETLARTQVLIAARRKAAVDALAPLAAQAMGVLQQLSVALMTPSPSSSSWPAACAWSWKTLPVLTVTAQAIERTERERLRWQRYRALAHVVPALHFVLHPKDAPVADLPGSAEGDRAEGPPERPASRSAVMEVDLDDPAH